MPDGIGIGSQSRIKKKRGKWNNYSLRVNRNVVFLGVQRVVPHAEQSTYRSYRSAFKKITDAGWEDSVRKIVSRILRKRYSKFWFAKHSSYRLPHVSTYETTYSGFNMGAGENALFEIFSIIFACPEGLLLVIDEIELGLHEEAQKRLLKELKEICNDKHIQIICTTHSPTIINSVPPESRFFVETYPQKTIITPGISALYAF